MGNEKLQRRKASEHFRNSLPEDKQTIRSPRTNKDTYSKGRQPSSRNDY